MHTTTMYTTTYIKTTQGHQCCLIFLEQKRRPLSILEGCLYFYFDVQFEIFQYQQKSNGAIYLSRYYIGL